MIDVNDPIRNYIAAFGSWELEDLIGEGSYGRVYRASRTDFGKRYVSAIKLITVPKTDTEVRQARQMGMDQQSIFGYFESMAGRIVNEINIMYSLRGLPNIVCYEAHEVFHKENEPQWTILIRMEYLRSFVTYIDTVEVSEALVNKLAVDILTALKACSAKNIIHRDIKDSNIFVADDGSFKLGDFGIAREMSENSRSMSMRGTPAYLAPEVYAGKRYDATVDIYSLGILLYKLLNDGRYPFMPPAPQIPTFEDTDMAFNKRMSGAPLPPPAHGSERLRAIVMRACSFDPRQRFQSADEFLRVLTDTTLPVYPSIVMASSDQEQKSVGAMPVFAAPMESAADRIAADRQYGSVTPQSVDRTLPLEPPQHSGWIPVGVQSSSVTPQSVDRTLPLEPKQHSGWIPVGVQNSSVTPQSVDRTLPLEPPQQANRASASPQGGESTIAIFASPSPTPEQVREGTVSILQPPTENMVNRSTAASQGVPAESQPAGGAMPPEPKPQAKKRALWLIPVAAVLAMLVLLFVFLPDMLGKPSSSGMEASVDPAETAASEPTEASTFEPALIVSPEASPVIPETTGAAVSTEVPTEEPTAAPIGAPPENPTQKPAATPTPVPAAKPTEKPAAAPTAAVTAKPTAAPAASQTARPAAASTASPTAAPTEAAAPVIPNSNGWEASIPAGVTSADYVIEELRQYRYRDVVETTESSESSLSGWEATGSHTEYSAWSEYGEWSTTPASNSDTCDVETQEVEKTKVQYRYTYYTGKKGGNTHRHFTKKWLTDNGYTSISSQKTVISDTQWTRTSGWSQSYGGSGTYYRFTKPGTDPDYNPVYSKSKTGKETVGTGEYETQYKVRTRTVVGTVYEYRRWGEFSEWQTEEPAASPGTREIKTRTVYKWTHR